MKRLILSTIPNDFDPNNDIPLGPWCFLDREKVYPEWESIPFEPDPFPTPEELAEASSITCIYANGSIPRLSRELNQKNKTQHSDKFWRLLLLPWLLTLIQTTWERQCRIRIFIDKFRDERFFVELLPDDIEWNFNDTVDFLYRGVLNPVYNWWLYSRLLDVNLPENWQVSYKKSTHASQSNIIRKTISWKQFIKEKIFYTSRLRCYGVYGIGLLSSSLWSMYLSLKPHTVNSRSYHFKENPEPNNIEWDVGISHLIKKTMPVCFQNLQMLETGKTRPRRGRVRLMGPVLFFNEPMKYKFALYEEAGEKLVLTQHGGMYGSSKVFQFGAEIEYVHKAFISWGWTRQEDYAGNICALASPYLSRYENKHSKKNNHLILVGTKANLYTYRLDSTCQSLEFIAYRKAKVSFLKALRKDIFEHTLYRPYYDDRGSLKDLSYFKENFPNLSISQGNLHSQILGCKLLILDHPVTTLNIAFASNTPTIGFWDKKTWAMCKQAAPYFEAFENAGVFFQTGLEAALKVNEIWDDTQGWWNQDKIQKDRRKWCHQYARTNNIWWWEWAKALWKM